MIKISASFFNESQPPVRFGHYFIIVKEEELYQNLPEEFFLSVENSDSDSDI